MKYRQGASNGEMPSRISVQSLHAGWCQMMSLPLRNILSHLVLSWKGRSEALMRSITRSPRSFFTSAGDSAVYHAMNHRCHRRPGPGKFEPSQNTHEELGISLVPFVLDKPMARKNMRVDFCDTATAQYSSPRPDESLKQSEYKHRRKLKRHAES